MTAMHKERLPFGRWPSPITAGLVASSGSGSSALPREIHVNETGVYWIEPRPEEGGRYVLRQFAGGKLQTLTPPGYSVRTKVHEYGGGSVLLSGGDIIFSNESDQRLYKQSPGESIQAITPDPEAGESIRYANGDLSPLDPFMIYVCERHEPDGAVENFLTVIPTDGTHAPIELHTGHDFYANPRISPDGRQLIWLTWDLPRMPWEGTDLWIGDIEGQKITRVRHLAGGVDEAIFQPEWGRQGEIFFVSDRTGWWNIYQYHEATLKALTQLEVDFAIPLWTLSYTTYTILPGRRIAASYLDKGRPGLALIHLDNGTFDDIEIDYNYMAGSIDSDPEGNVWFLAGSATAFPGLCRMHRDSSVIERVVEVKEFDIPEEHLSSPEHISFDSPMGGLAYAYYYPPLHPEYTGLDGEKPPLIVMGHGGPTSAARAYLNPEIQFWTSRGFAVADVDYSGSTGYGREYRDRLKGNWGIIDVADCVAAAQYLSDTARADPGRLLITGGSAGGYIVLRALTSYDLFAAGACYYGVADILALMKDTHKFEAGYDDYLVGPYPECADQYHDRSPINHADKLNAPMIIFQGLDDRVVPPSQSEILVAALQRNRVYHKYLTFEGEGHGFRQAKNIEAALKAELAFYREVLAIPKPGDPRNPPIGLH